MAAFYCAGNWKMNKTPEQASDFVRQLLQSTNVEEQQQLVLFPQALAAYEVANSTKGSRLAWGLQNIYHVASGAFTGENSATVAKEMGASYVLVGHSERRQIFAETDEMLSRKVSFAQEQGLIPVLCVGETQDDRRWGRTQEVIVRQTRLGLQNADVQKPIWIAYEPVWAIGTGVVATTDQVEEAHGILRRFLQEWSGSVGQSTPILYGGSVKSENAGSLAQLKNVNGFLIGGASLDPAEFLKIYRSSSAVSGNS